MDVDNIALGRDFRQMLRERLASCDLMLVLIGRSWVDAKYEGGQRRLEDANDFVRLEVSTALKRNIPVTPILVQGAGIPAVERLPDDLKELAYRHGIEISHSRWELDVREMVRRLGLDPGASTIPGLRRWWAAVLTGALLLFVIGGGGLLYHWNVGGTVAPAPEQGGVHAQIYTHDLGLTDQDAVKIKKSLELNGIPTNIAKHRNPGMPDAVFIGALVTANLARVALTSIPYKIQYIFPPAYPGPQGGDPEGFLIGLGYMSTYFQAFRSPEAQPSKISTTDLNHLLEPGLSNVEFQQQLSQIFARPKG